MLSHLPRWAATLLALTLGLALASPAAAQRRRRNSRELDAAVERLASPNPSDVRGAVEALGLLGNPGAVAPIDARIRRGLPRELLTVAIEALSILGRREAGPVLIRLSAHRRAEVRAEASRAIAATNPSGAEAALVARLGDSDADVRAAAARGLGTLGATGAVDTLFTALAREIPEAANAIAQLANPAQVERFLGLLGGYPFDRLAAALSEMLDRESLADSAKLTIVHRLTELATAEARAVLEQYASSDSHAASRQAAAEALPRMQQ